MTVIDLPVTVVLASASPARRDLLKRLVKDFDVVPSGVDEEAVARRELPMAASAVELAERLAAVKAGAVRAGRPHALVIGADTLVSCGGDIIGKPAGFNDAVRTLLKLSRSGHAVVTGLCVFAPDGRRLTACAQARLRLRRMSHPEAIDYVQRRPGALERAGVYALQPDDPNVVRLDGSESAVMGLPLETLRSMLRELYPEITPE